MWHSLAVSPELEVESERPEEEKEVLRQFIETYQSLPQLWNPTVPLYTNKAAKNRAYDELMGIYNKIKPNCTRENVKRKINTLRCNYRKELKKIRSSMISGNADSVYKPTSWVFYCLQFLDSIEQPIQHINDVNQESEADESSPILISTPDVPEVNINEEKTIEVPVSASQASIISETMQVLNKKARVLGPVERQNALIEKAITLLETVAPDVDDTPNIAKVWGEKLTGLETQQRLFAEKAINDILFEAALGTLNRHSVRINEPLIPKT